MASAMVQTVRAAQAIQLPGPRRCWRALAFALHTGSSAAQRPWDDPSEPPSSDATSGAAAGSAPSGASTAGSVGSVGSAGTLGDDPRVLVEMLYQRHARTIMAYLFHRLPSLADAEDALAEVFSAACAVCGEGTVPGMRWLMVTARRRVADFYRRRGRGVALSAVGSAALAARPADAAGEPEWVALRAEEQRELLALVARLPEEQQEVLALRFASGLPSAEIAAIIGKSDAATRAIISRTVRHLREELRR